MSLDTARRLLRAAVPVAAALTILGIPAAAFAADGDLDTTFNGGGIATWKLGSSDGAEAPSLAHDGALDSKGRIVAAGGADVESGIRFGVARLLPDGDPDESFSGDGAVTTHVGEGGTAHAVAIQPDDKVVVAGDASSEVTSLPQFALVRYTEAGAPDESFGGGDGIVTTPVVPGTGIRAVAYDVAVQADGKIVVAGYAPFASDRNLPRFVVARYTEAGVLDDTFDGDGIASVPVGQFGGQARALLLQPGGKVVVGGEASESWGQGFGLVRFTSTGALDETFGTGGKTITRLAEPETPETMSVDSTVHGLAQDAAGRIVAAGPSEDNRTRFGVARYSADGVLDGSFGTGGFVRTPIGNYAAANDVVVLPGGRIVAAGLSGDGDQDFALVAWTPAGVPDSAFGGGDGIVTTEIGGFGSTAWSAFPTPDGKALYVAGEGNAAHAVAKYAMTPGAVVKEDEPKKDEPKKDEPRKDEPKREEPKRETAKQTAPVAAPPAPAPSVVLPAAPRSQRPLRRCVSRRFFRVDLRALGIARGAKVAPVGARGKRAAVSGSSRSAIDLRKLPKGTYSVRITGRGKDGRRISVLKTYRTCR